MQDYDKIAKALQYIRDHAQEQPDLETVAEVVHLSPFHFQRLFTDWAGVSPKKFLQYLSLEHAKQILKQHASIAEAAEGTGLSGSGRLHDLFVKIEGMTPGEYKNGGRFLTIEYSIQESVFGKYLVASTSKGICNLFFFDESFEEVLDELKSLWPEATFQQKVNSYHEQLKEFFSHKKPEQIKLHLKGTAFQLKVWEALLRIPEGKLLSYSDIADTIQQPTAQRAVGTAIGSNPVGFIIPCHRVIKSMGGIGEYRWGSSRKMAMIGWEAARNQSS